MSGEEHDWGDPDPAAVPGEEDVFVGGDGVEIIAGDVSCTHCEHFPVCAVFSSIMPLMQDWHTEAGSEDVPFDADDVDAELPFEPDELAVICTHYAPTDQEYAKEISPGH